MRRKGFTLVELSIVLIIIGLLIGGILVAQSMIETVKVQRLLRNLQQYDIAISNFITKYNQKPGDSSLFVPSGDNNGSIQVSPGPGTCDSSNPPYTRWEFSNVWGHLTQAGILTGYTSYAPIECGGTDPSISTSMNSAGTVYPIFTVSDSWIGLYFGITTKNILLDYRDVYPTSRYFLSWTPPVTALALDAKLDDGVWNTGRVNINDTYYGGGCTTTTMGRLMPNGKETLCSFTYYLNR